MGETGQRKRPPDYRWSLQKMERVKGIEPSRPAWKAGALPLSYTRKKKWSEQQDSNLRPPGPKPGALPNCAMPRH